MNQAIEKSTQYYDEMKYKQALKYGFFELQSIKEDYLIAKEQKANPYTLMKFVLTQLILINPIIPHFAQFCWNKYAYPVFKDSQNFGEEINENLCFQAWPQISAQVDQVAVDRLIYLRKTKSEIRQGLEKAKLGGGKKKKGKQDEPAKVLEKCTVFIAKEYPEFQKKCLQVLQGFEFDDDNKIVGDHVTAIRDAFPDKKQAGLAMKFVAFQLAIA